MMEDLVMVMEWCGGGGPTVLKRLSGGGNATGGGRRIGISIKIGFWLFFPRVGRWISFPNEEDLNANNNSKEP